MFTVTSAAQSDDSAKSARKRHNLRFFRTGKIAQLVELAVFGIMSFGHNTQNIPLVQHRANVIKLILMAYGQPYANKHVGIFRFLRNQSKSSFGAANQRFLKEQIAACVARKAKFGKRQNVDALFLSFERRRYNGFRVVFGLRHPYFGVGYSHSQKSVIHVFPFLCLDCDFKIFTPMSIRRRFVILSY